jgi:hypothetical protein
MKILKILIDAILKNLLHIFDLLLRIQNINRPAIMGPRNFCLKHSAKVSLVLASKNIIQTRASSLKKSSSRHTVSLKYIIKLGFNNVYHRYNVETRGIKSPRMCVAIKSIGKFV